jgi:hypothetical protein
LYHIIAEVQKPCIDYFDSYGMIKPTLLRRESVLPKDFDKQARGWTFAAMLESAAGAHPLER